MIRERTIALQEAARTHSCIWDRIMFNQQKSIQAIAMHHSQRMTGDHIQLTSVLVTIFNKY
ncbi:hypothetical protein [Bacillus sp. V2I10]|uniref:hypothetical protein n=1 Tax=Bacillus sp. V2I10 TaxID=3042276 RepID=UPI00278610FA|nr:hypothetical protein [Bacillus sp. V2I10]MDQ0860675.1 hypothetical protein [Bacillus sp. V2I10]